MTGAEEIAAERKRQIEEEGYDEEHDDWYGADGKLAIAAACYAAASAATPIYRWQQYAASHDFVDPWPFEERSDRRPYNGNVLREPVEEERRRLLVKSGALLAAEIDRLDRKEKKS